MSDGKLYNFVIQQYNKGLKEDLKTLDKWRQTKKDQDSAGILTMIRDLTYGLKYNNFGTMAIVDCKYKFGR